MARVFITGSTDGLGLLAARHLLDDGHEVTLHARNDRRASDVRRAEPRASAVVVGDLSDMSATRDVAAQVNALGRHDAVIHNVSLGHLERRRAETVDGVEHVFAVNVIAPYLLTALITPPDRLVYVSSGMHHGADTSLGDLQWTRRHWNGSAAYSDSKFHEILLTNAVSRRWPHIPANSINPGWVPTRMGGRGAPDDLTLGATTQTWLATSADPAARVTGRYFFHREEVDPHPDVYATELQDELLSYCADLTGTPLPQAQPA
ncbi:SDR family NAD(P)-dependent oxidoreductase [Actinokineospora auranticolor]|uniref:NAD(P)-dependent dehydrogenase (Short-subunit alcohol dehydrogenase family) n=1 Tax=Actinokineospora auranticolor TaxID=155976 RepID=A0A2S6GI06_9PSEU|nr:SDR family NAD(P)-dependent oxidoreductase [Actinokineospora auranticolor]PPK64847.1 NAD(P)-dependent dehydrogenase (short-subunit alcohol dehydrogenase family) [Actinokineospora auranticolor]